MAVIVERTGGGRERRYLPPGGCLRIGRAYDNDLVIDDRHADPYHAELALSADGVARLRDNESLNGTRVNGKKIAGVVVVAPASWLVLGKTRLRVVDAASSLAAAARLSPTDDLLGALSHVLSLTLLFALNLAFLVASDFYTSIGDFKLFKNTVMSAAAFAGAVSAYAGFWTVVGKLQRSEGRFFTHAAVLMLIFLLFMLLVWIGYVANANRVAPAVFAHLKEIAPAVIVFALLFFGLSLSTTMKKTNLLLYPAAAAALVFALIYFNAYPAEEKFSHNPDYGGMLAPSAHQFNTPVPPREFTAAASALFTE